jgi:hypothetical protein
LYVSNAYETQINYLTDKFKNLKINVSGEYYIAIADDEVCRVMANKYGDGVGVTPTKAATITYLSGFYGNNTIVHFDELNKLSNLTSIGGTAFFGCTNLITCPLPQTITKLYNSCFNGCTKLTGEIDLPNLTDSGEGGWFWGTSITKVKNLGKITAIPTQAFRDCDKLEEVTIPDTCKTLGYRAFLRKLVM